MAAACRRAVSEAEPRLAEAHYLCAVQASAEALSGVYAVLGKRRSRILREEVRAAHIVSFPPLPTHPHMQSRLYSLALLAVCTLCS